MTPTMSIAAAIAIVAMLAIYAAYLGMQLRRQGKDQRASLEIFEQTRIQKDKALLEKRGDTLLFLLEETAGCSNNFDSLQIF